MDGTDAVERTIEKKEEDQNEFAEQDLPDTELEDQEFEGIISGSNIPEKIEIIDDEEPETEAVGTKTTLSPTYRWAEELELHYEILAEGKGLEVLEKVDSGENVSEISEALLELMAEQGIIESPDPGTGFTDRGRQFYSNWTGFRDNYLTGDTGHDRLEAIEKMIGDKAMPGFLEEASNVEVTLDQYLTNPESAKARYDPEKEFQAMMSALHSYQSSELGDRVRALEVLGDPDRYDGREVPEHIKKEFRNATHLGLLDDKDVLTQDGKALYRKVRADAYNLEW